MVSPLGQAVGRSRLTAVAALLCALVLVAADLLWLWRTHWPTLVSSSAFPLSAIEWLIPLVAVPALGTLARWDLASLGLRLRPAQGARYWLLAALIIGVAVLALAFALFLLGRRLGWAIPRPSLAPRDALAALPRSCIYYPLLEESIYRFTLCVGAAALLRPWGTVAASGAVFAGYHFVVRNPGPDNFVAGYFLAWAYLKSGSLAVPVALHALGNLCALLIQVGNWYLTR